MEIFDARWLTLREPVDHRSRATSVLEPLRQAWRTSGWSRVVDLGAGTGSNLRYLAPRLPAGQQWSLVDRDPDHLQRLRRLERPDGVERLEVVSCDLASPGSRWPAADVVTATALLDLVSLGWLTRLVNQCATARRGALFTLCFDGSIRWEESEDSEADPENDVIWDAVNQHQRGDKGFGPALGPAAAPVAERLFTAAGFDTVLVPSPWCLGAGEAPLIERLVEGWAGAAMAMRPAANSRVSDWVHRRQASVAQGTCVVTVGHWDLLALPVSKP